MHHRIMIVLERHEIENLKSGKMHQLTIGTQNVELYFETTKSGTKLNSLNIATVMETVTANPGLIQREIGEKLGRTYAQVDYHLQNLLAKKLIFKDSNAKFYRTKKLSSNDHKPSLALAKNGH